MGIKPINNLSFSELNALLRSVFALGNRERSLTLLVDLPDRKLGDTNDWVERRSIAGEWYTLLAGRLAEVPFSSIMLCTYPNVGSNNNDLPAVVTVARSTTENAGKQVPLQQVLESSSVVLAPTQLSATAPLKNLAKTFRFRGATLPGFTREMIPALMLDYERVHNRVMQLKSRLDRATTSRIVFTVEGVTYSLQLDLRYRTSHASGGLIREEGTVANLPSGEAYIVPYEGERSGDPSRTSGLLPVQFGEEIVVYRIDGNRAVEVTTRGESSTEEADKLRDDPAYGNIAELGLGILGDWGVKAMGSILLDEKLGLHIAFGRSEHFGGITSPSSFKKPENVIHIDRVYVPSCQPRILVQEASFEYENQETEVIMREGKYSV